MSEIRTYRTHAVASPVGPLLLVFDPDGALTMIAFLERRTRERVEAGLAGRGHVVHRDPEAGAEAARQLDEYFAGQRRVFELRLAPTGTEFQRQAWRALEEIPYGQTRSYAEQARAMGRPNAIRAIGRANGANPIAIVVPCHRVIGADGSLTGYGGGLEVKRQLLRLEGAWRPRSANQLSLM